MSNREVLESQIGSSSPEVWDFLEEATNAGSGPDRPGLTCLQQGLMRETISYHPGFLNILS